MSANSSSAVDGELTVPPRFHPSNPCGSPTLLWDLILLFGTPYNPHANGKTMDPSTSALPNDGNKAMTLAASTHLNDVDLEAVGGLVQSIKDDPAKAKSTWAARITWKGAFASESKVREFEPTQSDEPPTLGGADAAANPAEQLLTALGNCLAVGYAANASVAGIKLDDLRIDVKGGIDLHPFLGLSDGHAGFESISATVKITSDAPREQLEELHAKVQATSPIGHTVAHPVPVEFTLA